MIKLRFVSDSVVDFDIILPVSVPLVAWTVGQVLWRNTGMKINVVGHQLFLTVTSTWGW